MTMNAPDTMRAQFDVSAIRGYWTGQATKHGQSHAASWSDRPAIELETEKLASYLAAGDRVIDIGCANGCSTLELAARKDINIRGIDYIPEMITQANQHLADVADKLPSRVAFAVGDITQLEEPGDHYDKAIVIRVIINLAEWEQQKIGLRQAARVVKPGGLLLLSEATLQGWQKLNAFRNEWGLADIPMPAFNLYLDEEKVRDALAPEMELVEISNFASTYFVGTRVLKPLFAKLVGQEAAVTNPEMHWNEWFASLPAAGDYGTQKLFVFRKRG